MLGAAFVYLDDRRRSHRRPQQKDRIFCVAGDGASWLMVYHWFPFGMFWRLRAAII
jgi:hypothetical protein